MFIDFDLESNILELADVKVSLHCHHYNCGIIMALEEIKEIDVHSIIVQAASEEFYKNFARYIRNRFIDRTADEKLKAASELYRFMGFGRLDLSDLDESGGKAYADSSHYVIGWLAKYERRSAPVCYLTCGFLGGVLSAVYEKSLTTYSVEEVQ
jgi:predicted hydrocarbon binding protein